MARERREAEAAAQKALEKQPAATPEGFYAPYFGSEFRKLFSKAFVIRLLPNASW